MLDFSQIINVKQWPEANSCEVQVVTSVLSVSKYKDVVKFTVWTHTVNLATCKQYNSNSLTPS